MTQQHSTGAYSNTTLIDGVQSSRHNNIIKEAILRLTTLKRDNRLAFCHNELRSIIRLLEGSTDPQQTRNMSYFSPEVMNDLLRNNFILDFPSLTTGERRICVLTLLHMSTKEISDVTRQSVGAVQKARIRLRKKLGLTNSQTTLLHFLESYRFDSKPQNINY